MRQVTQDNEENIWRMLEIIFWCKTTLYQSPVWRSVCLLFISSCRRWFLDGFHLLLVTESNAWSPPLHPRLHLGAQLDSSLLDVITNSNTGSLLPVSHSSDGTASWIRSNAVFYMFQIKFSPLSTMLSSPWCPPIPCPPLFLCLLFLLITLLAPPLAASLSWIIITSTNIITRIN